MTHVLVAAAWNFCRKRQQKEPKISASRSRRGRENAKLDLSACSAAATVWVRLIAIISGVFVRKPTYSTRRRRHASHTVRRCRRICFQPEKLAPLANGEAVKVKPPHVILKPISACASLSTLSKKALASSTHYSRSVMTQKQRQRRLKEHHQRLSRLPRQRIGLMRGLMPPEEQSLRLHQEEEPRRLLLGSVWSRSNGPSLTVSTLIQNGTLGLARSLQMSTSRSNSTKAAIQPARRDFLPSSP